MPIMIFIVKYFLSPHNLTLIDFYRANSVWISLNSAAAFPFCIIHSLSKWTHNSAISLELFTVGGTILQFNSKLHQLPSLWRKLPQTAENWHLKSLFFRSPNLIEIDREYRANKNKKIFCILLKNLNREIFELLYWTSC